MIKRNQFYYLYNNILLKKYQKPKKDELSTFKRKYFLHFYSNNLRFERKFGINIYKALAILNDLETDESKQLLERIKNSNTLGRKIIQTNKIN